MKCRLLKYYIPSSAYLTCSAIYLSIHLKNMLVILRPVYHLNFDTVVGNKVVSPHLNGTIHGAMHITGRHGNALSFNGINQYVHFGYPTNACFTNPESCSNGLTIAMWLQLPVVNPTGKERFLISAGLIDNSQQLGWRVEQLANNRLGFRMRHQIHGYGLHVDPFPDTWFHFGVTWNTTNICLYHDGICVSCDNWTSNVISAQPSLAVLFGKPATVNDYYAEFMIDDFLFWDEAKSALFIRQLANSYID